MYKLKHFAISELVDRPTFEKYLGRYGSAANDWIQGNILDERLMRLIDVLWEDFNTNLPGWSMTINNWMWGGPREYSGWRSPDCELGASMSQHRFGRAVDIIPSGLSAEGIRSHLVCNQNITRYQDIGGLELSVSWLHIDVRARRNRREIRLF
jgi:hypothetical protein